MRRRFAVAFALAAVSVAVTARTQDFFADGTHVVWLGDSITHACLFTRYLEDYAWTRYPDRELAFDNAGVSGDRVADAIVRFDSDVAIWKPTRVLVSFGMNDAGFAPYSDERLRRFEEHLAVLLDQTQKIGAGAVLMSSPPHDAISERSRRGGLQLPDLPADYGTTLQRFAEAMRRQAAARDVPFIDLQTPIGRQQARLRHVNPGATLIPDGIHPSPAGSALIAMQVLRQLGERGPRMRILFDASGVRVEGGRLEADDQAGPNATSCSVRAAALPWPLPLEAREATLLDEYYAERNELFVRHTQLPPGLWELRVDGLPLHAMTAVAWSRGVDLGLVTEHPDWHQALRLSEHNGLRNSLIRAGIRDLWEARRIAATPNGEGTLQREAERRVEVLRAQLEDIGRRILELAQAIEGLRAPRPHRYEWVRRGDE